MDRRAFSLYVVIAVLIIGFCRLIGGSSVTTPNSFVNGTVANADEVNANFDALRVGTNANFSRIQDLETQVLGLEAQVLDLDTRLSNIEAIVDPDLVDRVTALENASQSQQAVENLFYIQECEARFRVDGWSIEDLVGGPGFFVLDETEPLSGVTLDVDVSLLFDVPRDGIVLFEVYVERPYNGGGNRVQVTLGSDLICDSYPTRELADIVWRRLIAATAGTHRLTVNGWVRCSSSLCAPAATCADHRMPLTGFTAELID